MVEEERSGGGCESSNGNFHDDQSRSLQVGFGRRPRI